MEPDIRADIAYYPIGPNMAHKPALGLQLGLRVVVRKLWIVGMQLYWRGAGHKGEDTRKM